MDVYKKSIAEDVRANKERLEQLDSFTNSLKESSVGDITVLMGKLDEYYNDVKGIKSQLAKNISENKSSLEAYVNDVKSLKTQLAETQSQSSFLRRIITTSNRSRHCSRRARPRAKQHSTRIITR